MSNDFTDRLTPKEEQRARAAMALCDGDQAAAVAYASTNANAEKNYAGKALGLIGGQCDPNTKRLPDLGEIVLVDLGHGGKSMVKPGIVTSVWGPNCINVRVLNDGEDVQLNSLMHKSKVPPPSSYAQPRPRYWFRRYEGEPIS